MSIKKTNIGTWRSVVAIAQEESKLKAIELREKGGAIEVLWTKSSIDSGTDWHSFAAECGLSVEPTARKDAKSSRTVVVGFNTAGVAFYRVNVPVVGKEETAAMVKLQAETQLPLPAEQMELSWRTDRQMKNGQVGVTIAAARKEPLQGFVENVQSFKPAKILLDCEGIVKGWLTFFAGNEQNAVIVNMAARNTQVCLAEDRQLSNAVVLDMGIDDFAAEPEAEHTQTYERFIQDMRSVLELFGYTDEAELPIVVLSDGDAEYVSIVSSLRLAGLNSRVALPDVKKLRVPNKIGVEGIYEYRVPIGLGLVAIEAGEDELDIFEHLYSPTAKEEKIHWLHSPKIAGAIAAVMLVLSLAVFFAVDVASPGVIEKRLSASDSEAVIDLLMQRQKLIKAVAQQRPDLLDLLGKVTASGDSGIKLESFHFKKGQAVTISGQLKDADQLYKFQENLRYKLLFNVDSKFQSDLDNKVVSEEMREEFKENKTPLSRHAKASVEQASNRWVITDRLKKYLVKKESGRLNIYMSRKSITDVKRQSSSLDAKTKKIKFTITFHYKNFTK